MKNKNFEKDLPCGYVQVKHIDATDKSLVLLLFKYRQKTLLVKDLGPEQFLYLPESEVK